MALDLQCTPMPTLPMDGNVPEPTTPKRVRRTSEALNRRVKANIGALYVPSMNEIGAGSRLTLQPQARSLVSSSYSKTLLSGAMKKIQERQQQKKQQEQQKQQQQQQVSPQTSRALPRSMVRPTTPRNNNSRNLPVIKNMRSGTNSLLSLRMAAMLKTSPDQIGLKPTVAHMKFGAPRTFNVPGRANSSPYRPSRAIPTRSRSFNAVCA